MTETNLLTVREAAQLKKTSVHSVIRWITKGFRGKKLYAERVGWQYRINVHTFQKFLSDIGAML